MEYENKGKYSVYIHINKINGKMYVGITSQKCEKRWNKGNGYKNCTYFYRSILKYGWDNFEHEIIAQNLTDIEAKNFEITLIKKIKAENINSLYNLTDGGDGASGYKINEETRLKMSKARIGRAPTNAGIKLSKEWRKNISNGMKEMNRKGSNNKYSLKIICLNNLNIYYGERETCKLFGIKQESLSLCLNNKSRYAGKDKYTGEPLMWEIYNDKKVYKEKRYDYPDQKHIKCCNTDEYFINCTDAFMTYGIDISSISKACRGRKFAGKINNQCLEWKYVSHEEFIKNYDLSKLINYSKLSKQILETKTSNIK